MEKTMAAKEMASPLSYEAAYACNFKNSVQDSRISYRDSKQKKKKHEYCQSNQDSSEIPFGAYEIVTSGPLGKCMHYCEKVKKHDMQCFTLTVPAIH